MRRLLIIGLLLVLAACQEATPSTVETPQTYRCDDGTIVTAITDCPPPAYEPPTAPEAPTTPEPVVQDTTPHASVANQIFAGEGDVTGRVIAELAAVRERAEEKAANGYAFTLMHVVNGFPNTDMLNGARITVRGTQFAVQHDKEILAPDGTKYLDWIVADATTRTATAWCIDCGRRNQEAFSIPYDTVEMRMAKDWLYALRDVTYTGSERIDGRGVLRMHGTLDGESITLYTDEFSGIPVRVVHGGETIDFKSISLSAPAAAFDPKR